MSQEAQPRTRIRRRLAFFALTAAALAGLGIGSVAHFADDDPAARGALALPSLHGQASWKAGERPAPPISLRDQTGSLVSLAELRGRSVLLTFFDSRCDDQCPITGRQLGTILENLTPADRPTLMIVSVNPAGDTPASIRQAMKDWRLSGPWRWHWLRGSRSELASVWDDYGVSVEPKTNEIGHSLVLYLIDGKGFERTGYLFPFLPNFVALDLKTLRAEAA